jgi:hypothetical protein
MPAKDRPNTSQNPWSAPVLVAQIPDAGLHRDIEADGAVRNALASVAGLRGVEIARASFDLTPGRNDSVHVRGTVIARVGQVCVVSLDPIENEVVEEIDVLFVPESQVPALADSIDEGDDEEAGHEVPDPPEPIVNGTIDLGRLATDALFLGLDPYPRKPDVVFEPPSIRDDPDDHPFAALKALKNSPDRPAGKRRKRD